MKKQIKAFVNLIIICSLAIYSNRIVAQPSRVDSVIHLFNKSINNSKLDSANIDAAFELLATASLTDTDINQIETAALRFDSLKYYFESFNLRLVVLNKILYTDAGKAISYGKLQIEKIDKLSHLELTEIKARFLGLLRIPFRNTDRLEEGFRYYTQKLNDYKIRKDSSGISQCYFVLGGFYRTSGLIDLAIYNSKKSISYLDAVKRKAGRLNHISNIASYHASKGDLNESLKYYRLIIKEKERSRFELFYTAIGMAGVFIEANQLDSAAFYINIARSDTSP